MVREPTRKKRSLSRRTVLRSSATGAVFGGVALAGCMGGDDDDGADDGNGADDNGADDGNGDDDNGADDGNGDENGEDEDEWIQLFNGEDLDDWIPKILGYEADEDPYDTWDVEDGILTVRYDEYDGGLQNRFGHLFFDDEFDHYILHAKWRFPEDEVIPEDQMNWNYKNNGLMLHGERPEEMDLNQDFPRSIEYQVVGPYGDDSDRPLGDVCTPDMHAETVDGELITVHCWNENSEEDVLGTNTYRGHDWYHTICVVRSNELTQHINYDEGIAIEYQNPQLSSDGTIIEEGTISIQSEGHPTDFEVIELLPLDPDHPYEQGEIPEEVDHLMDI